jgi:hypothetical protein
MTHTRTSQDACGARGSSLPRTPTGRGAVADLPEYRHVATAPVRRASTPKRGGGGKGRGRMTANADGGDAVALTALPADQPAAGPAVSAAACKMRGPGSRGAPASGAMS